VAAGERMHDKTLTFTRTVTLPTPGVWYLWIRIKEGDRDAHALDYDLDGRPFRSGRGRIVVGPYGKDAWTSSTASPGFRAEVFADRPGDHRLRLHMDDGNLTVDRIALTLDYSARPLGDTLDHTDDPGGGRAFFPSDGWDAEGYQPGRPAPALKASRRFHVDAVGGDDGQDGLSPAMAWKTFARVNGRVFMPGDAILLKRGSTWDEPLRPLGNGTAANRIELAAYGEGPDPRIEGHGRTAVLLENQSYWSVAHLAVSAGDGHEVDGLRVGVTTTVTGLRPRGIRIADVVASESGGVGISVGGSYGTSDGMDDVEIDNCLAYANAGGGILVEGWHQQGWRHAVIRNCTAWSNNGWGGIYLNGGRDGLIEQCRAFNNYFLNLWFWNAVGVTVRGCETFRGHTTHEAGGFDLDYSVIGSTIEGCYSHHNQHYGFMLMGAGRGVEDAPKQSRFNVVRNCIAEDDRPPFWVIETFQDSIVHNCLSLATGAGRASFEVTGWPETSDDSDGGWPSRCRFVNNVFIARGGAVPLLVDDEATRGGNVLDHNWLWQMDSGTPLIRWGGSNWNPKDWGIAATVRPWKSILHIEEARQELGPDCVYGAGNAQLIGPVGAGVLGVRAAFRAYRQTEASILLSTGSRDLYPATWQSERGRILKDPSATGDSPVSSLDHGGGLYAPDIGPFTP